MADINYSYLKMRKNFGRQPLFCEVPVHLLDNITPDLKEQRHYILRNPVNQASQNDTPYSEHTINTKQVVMQITGTNHGEGGWPKEVNFMDEEATTRFRRRVERDDDYVAAILGTYETFNFFINQNNAIEMYEMYFKGMVDQPPLERSAIKVTNVYRDTLARPISSIDWTVESDSKLVVAYCNRKFPIIGPVNNNYTCYIWDVENPNFPMAEFYPPTPCWQVVCSPVEPTQILAGLNDGRVCIFDTRTSKEPIAFSPAHLAHRDPVSSLLFLHSRFNSEFFSGSSDGQVMWWDIRDLSEPTDNMVICFRARPGERAGMGNAEGVSSMHFDRSFPTRFLCGTDTGFMININRKGKTTAEVMGSLFEAHNGAVKSVQRSSNISKMFVSCGDWTVHVWSDDVHVSPIVTGMPQRHQVNDVCWAPMRVSNYMSISEDGIFRVWDFLRKYREPVTILPISKDSLLRLKPHPEGANVAVGDIKGKMYLLALSDNLVNSYGRDKQFMGQIYDRESKREHILEARVKEIKLKLLADKEGTAGADKGEVVDEEALVKVAEDDYRKTVVDELKRTGYTLGAGGAGAKGKMRKR